MSKDTQQLFIAAVLGILAMLMLSGCGQRQRAVNPPDGSYLFIMQESMISVCQQDQCMPAKMSLTGSGFVVASGGGSSLAITAGHVCSGPSETSDRKVRVVAVGGSIYPAEIVLILENPDACLLHIRGVHLPTVKMADRPPSRGDRVFSFSSPGALFDAELVPKFEGFYAGPTTEVVSPEGTLRPVMDGYTIPAKPGSSGGPVFNRRGELIGMISMSRPGFENFALSPTYASVRAIVLAAKAKVGELP